MSISKKLLSRLDNPDLLRAAALVAGDWLNVASSGKTFDVTNPSTGEIIAVLPDLGIDETRVAIEAAYSAQKAWTARTGKDRGAVLRRFFDLIVANANDLATILTMEMVSPIPKHRAKFSTVPPLSNGFLKKPNGFMAIPFQAIRRTNELWFSNSPSVLWQQSRHGTSPMP